MNHEPNLIQWHKGAIVIHDAAAKEPKMLMRVIGYTRDGLVKTQYIDKRRKRTIHKNPKESLHDPRRFDQLAQGLPLRLIAELPEVGEFVVAED